MKVRITIRTRDGSYTVEDEVTIDLRSVAQAFTRELQAGALSVEIDGKWRVFPRESLVSVDIVEAK